MALFELKEIRDRGRYSLSGFFCLQRENFSPPTSDFPFRIQPHLDNSLKEVPPKVTSLISWPHKHEREMYSNRNEHKTPRTGTYVNLPPDTQHISRVQHLLLYS